MDTINTPVEQEFHRDYNAVINQVTILYSQSVSTHFFALAAAVSLTVVLWNIADRLTLILWILAVSLHAVARYTFLWKFRKCKLVPGNAGKWLNRFILSVFISGFIWGMAGIILLPYDNSTEFTLYNSLTLLVICGLVSGALTSYSINLWVLIAYSLPALLPPAIYLILLGDKFNSVFGGFILLYLCFVSVAAVRMNSQFRYYLEMDLQCKEATWKYEKLRKVYSDYRKHIKK